MKLLITGICGFTGSTLARTFREHFPDWTISGIDNLSRPGSELKRASLSTLGVTMNHGDLLAGFERKRGSRQVIENNLYGTVNLSILAEIARHAEAHLEWLNLSGASN